MCHAETVSKAGVVWLEKSRLYLDLFNSDVSNVDILVTLRHCNWLKCEKWFQPPVQNRHLKKVHTIFFFFFSFCVNFYKMAFIVLLTVRLDLWANWMELYKLGFSFKRHCLFFVFNVAVESVKDLWSFFCKSQGLTERESKALCLSHCK